MRIFIQAFNNLVKKYIFYKKIVFKIYLKIITYPFLGKFVTEMFLFVDTWFSTPLNWIISDFTRKCIIKGLLSSVLCTFLIWITLTTGNLLIEICKNNTLGEIYEIIYLKNSNLLNFIRSPFDNFETFLKQLTYRNSKNILKIDILKDISTEKAFEKSFENELLEKGEKKDFFWKGFFLLIGFIITTETLVEVVNLLKDL